MITASILRNPNVLSDPAFTSLLERSYNAVPHSHDFLYAEVVKELAGYITAPDQFMFVGYEDYLPKAVCYGDYPVARLFPFPILHSLYNEGTRACGRELRKTLMDYLVNEGYTSLMVMNGTGRPDEVWLRTMLLPGTKSKPLGTIHLFELEGTG